MFDSAFLKVERAYAHIENIQGIIDGLGKSNKAHFDIGKYPNTNTRYIHYNIGNSISPDLALSIGDAIHNLRAALDHAMWEFQGLPGGKRNSETSFPFGKSKTDYEAACRGIKTAVPNTGQFFISLEAYETGKGKLLYGLNRLNILDKHKILTPVISVTEIRKIKIKLPNGQAWTREFGQFVVNQDGISKILLDIPDDNIIECHGDANPTINVSFGDVEIFKDFPLFDTLIELYTIVKGTLFEFRDFIRANSPP